MDRRSILKTAASSTAALTAISGCLGLTNDGGNTRNNNGEPDSEDIPAYTWTEGESYQYAVAFTNFTQLVTWTAIEVDGNNVTIQIEKQTEGDDKVTSNTITGTMSNIYQNVREHEGTDNLLLPLRSSLRYVIDRNISVGDQFEYEVDRDFDKFDIEVVEETTVKGVTCYKLEATIEGQSFVGTHFIQTSNNYPFTVSTIFEDSDDSQTLELVEEERP